MSPTDRELPAVVVEMLTRANELRGTADAAEIRDWAMRIAALHQGREDGRAVVVTDAMVEAACDAAWLGWPTARPDGDRARMRAALVAALEAE